MKRKIIILSLVSIAAIVAIAARPYLSSESTTMSLSTYTPKQSEIMVDKDKVTLVVGDGYTKGGAPLMRQDGATVGATSQVQVFTNGITSNTDSTIHGLTVGLGAGAQITNNVLGYQSLYSNTNGSSNNAIGYQVLYSNTTGASNNAIGYKVLYANTNGGHNIGIGELVLRNNISGAFNNAMGFQTLYSNVSGSGNNAIGYQTLYSNTADFNNAMGYQALYSNTTGTGNVAIGDSAGYTATPANANVSGSNNTWIGNNSGPGTATQLSNATAIGNGARNLNSNEISLGNSSVTSVTTTGVIKTGGYKSSDGSTGVTAGPYTTITSITIKNGLITAVTGN